MESIFILFRVDGAGPRLSVLSFFVSESASSLAWIPISISFLRGFVLLRPLVGGGMDERGMGRVTFFGEGASLFCCFRGG